VFTQHSVELQAIETILVLNSDPLPLPHPLFKDFIFYKDLFTENSSLKSTNLWL